MYRHFVTNKIRKAIYLELPSFVIMIGNFTLLKGFFCSFSLLLLRVKGRGCHTLLKPYETNCGLWIWAIQIKFDWLIDMV